MKDATPLKSMGVIYQEEKKHLYRLENFYSTSLSLIYIQISNEELPWVSAGYKCLMYLDQHSDSMLQQDRGNKVDKNTKHLRELLYVLHYVEIHTAK